MKQTKGWIMSKGNEYMYVQVGMTICRLHAEYEVTSPKEMVEFANEHDLRLLRRCEDEWREAEQSASEVA